MHNSLGRRNSWGSRERSSSSHSRGVGDRNLCLISLSRDLAEQMLRDIDGSMIAQVGDSGDRVAMDDHDRDDENCDVRSVENDFRFESYLLGSSKSFSPVTEEIKSPLPIDPVLNSIDKDQMQNRHGLSFEDNQYKLSQRLNNIFYMIHLVLFGILGVLTRYLLQKLFGPNPLYLDLPSNMLGSFLMGWIGVVFKADIRYISEHLAVGLSTGYLGSLTTFSGWNQKVLDLASKGHWYFAIGGIILGMLVVYLYIYVGVESATRLHKSLSGKLDQSGNNLGRWKINSLRRHTMVAAFMLFLLGSL